jgi:hypothetical protein
MQIRFEIGDLRLGTQMKQKRAEGLPALKRRSPRRVPEEPFETEPWLLLRARHAEGVRLEACPERSRRGHGWINRKSPIANRRSPIT